METTPNYRLERWIAVLLFLLFFLPFVANAEELLFTDTFRGDAIRNRSGERFLALVFDEEGARLEPVAIRVVAAYDPLEDLEGQKSGKRVEADGVEFSYLMRGARLHPGRLAAATPARLELPADAPHAIEFNGALHMLYYRCAGEADENDFVQCALILESHGTKQPLAEVSAHRDAREDLQVLYSFAGDLDRDGRLDLLIDVSADEHEWHPALFLSSAAKPGELLGKVAELVSAGC